MCEKASELLRLSPHCLPFASALPRRKRARGLVAADAASMLLAVLLACAAWAEAAATLDRDELQPAEAQIGATPSSGEHGSEHGSEMLHGPPPRADGEYSGGLMARMRNGGGDAGSTAQALSSDEQGMLKAMADQFRASNPSRSLFAAHGSHDLPKPNASGGATMARSITLMAQGGSVIVSELDGKVQLKPAPGTNDGGIRLLSAWCPDWAPVCAADGHTLPSACWARSIGLEVSHSGACPGAAPQQAGDGEGRAGGTSGSSASMVEASLQPRSLHGLKPSALPARHVSGTVISSSFEVVDSVCGCPLLQLLDAAPVCGTNGKTYDSYCRARCEQIELSHLGPCTTKGQVP